MSLGIIVGSSLESAWDRTISGSSPAVIPPSHARESVANILSGLSAPNRQLLLTILTATVSDPGSNPASLQAAAGVDRRSQAMQIRDALSRFKIDKGLTLKISQGAGVSHQWRAAEITSTWVEGRRKRDRQWALAFLDIVTWLQEVDVFERQRRAQELLDFVSHEIVLLALASALDYPRFRVTPRLAMVLVKDFMERAPDGPDAAEAVVTVAVRALSNAIDPALITERRDINSPDPIDVVIRSRDGAISSGIEVTEGLISLGKVEHEVVPAMLALGLDRATVVSRGVLAEDSRAIDAYLARAWTHFGLRVDLVQIEIIERWLNFPGTPRDLSTDFLWGVGAELDSYSTDGNRRAWFDVLSNYASSISSD